MLSRSLTVSLKPPLISFHLHHGRQVVLSLHLLCLKFFMHLLLLLKIICEENKLCNAPLFSEILLRDETPNETCDLALYWDSWDQHQVMKSVGSTSPRPPRNRAERSSVPSEDCLPYNNNNYNNCNNLGGSISTLATASSTSSIISLPQPSTPTHPGHAPLSPPVHQCTPPSTPPVAKGKGESYLNI